MSFITLNIVGGTIQDGKQVGGSITGSANGKSFGVTYSEDRWNAMQAVKAKALAAQSMDELRTILLEEFDPLTQESYKDVVESKSQYLYVNPATNKFYLKYRNVVSKEPLPQVFVDRILKSVELGMDPKPLIKCWVRFCRNPNYSADKAQLFAWYINQKYTDPKLVQKLTADGLSIERATETATSFQTPITEEGLICTYKVSREITKKYITDPNDTEEVKQVSRYDFEVDEFTGLKKYKEPEHVEERFFVPAVQGQSGNAWTLSEINGVPDLTDTHLIKVGKVHTLKDWKMVNCNDRQSCVPGLHCGNLDYIRSYQSSDTVTHNILVDPMNIGAIVQDGTGALRVKEYMVWSSFAGVNRSLYHSATYAKWKDEEYAAMVSEVVAKTREDAIAAAEEAFAQKADLVD